MARCVRMKADVAYTDLKRLICNEFSVDEQHSNAQLSYWVKGVMDVMVGGTMPPVYIESEKALKHSCPCGMEMKVSICLSHSLLRTTSTRRVDVKR
ncbi:unnamed protein product [Arabis nemorensis]|uniref:Uncharacterized protein n=1 Tax=Arabis nemorensis TaxID=586526 RepID=A0A565AXD4_9BRAS|nr:unnamed protein product [Arabis nemorensis]